MARKNKMYERMYVQLVRECNQIEDSLKSKVAIVVPDTLTIEMFSKLANGINIAVEKIVENGINKIPSDFRKIYPKLADSFAVLTNCIETLERDKKDTEKFESITDFESAVSEMIKRKETLKSAIQAGEKSPENAPVNESEKSPENAPVNESEKSPENAPVNESKNRSRKKPEM